MCLHYRYKERLELKYMRTNPKAAALNGKKWTFVRSDMDDLRSGVPVPMTDKDMVIKVCTYVYSHPLPGSKLNKLILVYNTSV